MKTKHIAIPQPCNQSWAEMQIMGQGRFCNSCRKTVIDFTGYDDEAFIAYFQKAKEIPCGRVTTNQLNLTIPSQQTPLLRPVKLYRYIAAGLLSIAGIPAATQARQIAPTVVNPAEHHDSELQQTEPDSSEIRGRVVDEKGEGLPGASIHVANSKSGTVTDVDGNFALSVNVQERSSGVLEIKWLDYITVKIPLNTFKDKTTIKMEPGENRLLGVIAIVRKPNLWKRITSPFRRKY